MFAEEWALMMFTLLVQLGIGSFIMLIVMRSILEKKDRKLAAQITNKGFIAIGPVVGLGLILSVFHLGDPLGAYRAIINIGSSWLSREIVLSGGFFVLLLASIYFFRKGKGNSIGWITAVVGLIAVFAMGSAYASSVKPAWTSLNTYIVFYGTTLVFGAAGAISSVVYSLKGQSIPAEVGSLLKKVSWVGLAGVVLPLIYLPVYISGLNGGVEAAQASAGLLTGSYMVQLVLHVVFSAVGLGMAVYFLSRQGKQKNMAIPASTIYLALALILAGEFLGRYVFYATAVTTMIG